MKWPSNWALGEPTIVASSSSVSGEQSESGSRRALGARAGWVTVDQVLSSAANFLLTIILARQLSPQSFGAFAISMSLALFTLGVSQTLTGQVLAIRFSAAMGRERNAAAESAVGLSLLIGLVGAAPLLLAGILIGGATGAALLATSLVVPALLVQDAWRAVFITRGRPAQAVLNDGLWIGVQLLIVVVLVSANVTGTAPYIFAWGIAALASAIFGCHQAGVVPRIRGWRAWLSVHWDISRFLLFEWVTVLGSIQVALILVAIFGSVSDVGAIRGAQALLGPLNVIGLSVTAFTIPELSRRRLPPRRLMGAASAVSGTLFLAAAAYGAVLLVLSPGAGSALLGETWPEARIVLPAAVAYACANALKVGPECVLRSLGLTRLVFVDGFVLAMLLVPMTLIGLWLWGAYGAVAGMAVAAIFVVPLAWALVWRAVRGRAVASRADGSAV